MPRLWNENLEAHRRAVHSAILDTAWALVTEHGLLSVTMSQIAEQTGIGRATLYKYFPDVEAILLACHERQVTDHLHHLIELREEGGDAGERLESVLAAYAHISYHRRHHGSDALGSLLHRREHVGRAQQQIHHLLRELLTEAAEGGTVRDDVAADELANFCLSALTAASSLTSEAAVRRLVALTLTGVRAGNAGAPVR